MNKIDLSNKKFFRLTVIKEVGNKWLCKCECGNETEVRGTHLRTGHTKSCGCLSKEGNNNLKHGQGKKGLQSPEYKIWAQMIKRCHNKKYHRYYDYGGRGIKVCARWRNSFENFFADMGKKPSPELSLERQNNNLGYYKDNCKWGTTEEQNRNKRNNIWITYDGETKILQDWSRKIGAHHSQIKKMLFDKNMSIGQIMAYYQNKIA